MLAKFQVIFLGTQLENVSQLVYAYVPMFVKVKQKGDNNKEFPYPPH